MRLWCKKPFLSTTYHFGVIGSQSLFIFSPFFDSGKNDFHRCTPSENGLYEVSELNSDLFLFFFFGKFRYMQSKISWFYAEEKEQVLNAKWKKKFWLFWESSRTGWKNFGFFILFFWFFLIKVGLKYKVLYMRRTSSSLRLICAIKRAIWMYYSWDIDDFSKKFLKILV